jgi:hypothetical protein
MAAEHFQRLQSVSSFTEVEKMVLGFLPSSVTAAGFSESREQATDRLLRFEGEHGQLKFFTVWESPTRTYQLRIPGLHSMFDNTDVRFFGVGQREADIIGGLLISAVRAANFMSGRIHCFSRCIRLITASHFKAGSEFGPTNIILSVIWVKMASFLLWATVLNEHLRSYAFWVWLTANLGFAK